jgi:hypothetical protein
METTTKQGRGQLTERIKQKSKELLGYEISQIELRLLPHIQYTLANSQRLDPKHLDRDEMDLLAEYVRKGHILDGVTETGRPMLSEGIKLKITKDFYDMISELVWLGYVDLN